MAELFQRASSVITKHIKNVFEDGEFRKKACAKFAHYNFWRTCDRQRRENSEIPNFPEWGGIGGGIKRASQIHGVIASELS